MPPDIESQASNSHESESTDDAENSVLRNNGTCSAGKCQERKKENNKHFTLMKCRYRIWPFISRTQQATGKQLEVPAATMIFMSSSATIRESIRRSTPLTLLIMTAHMVTCR